MIRSPIQIQKRTPIQPQSQGDLMALLQEFQRLFPQFKLMHQQIMESHASMQKQIASIKQGPPGPRGDNGKDAPFPDHKAIADELTRRIRFPKDGKNGRDGRDAKPLNPDEVVEHIVKNKKLKTTDVDGLEQTLAVLRNLHANGGIRGGGDTVAAGTGVSISVSNGVKTISASVAIAGTQEKSTTTPNGVLTTFTFTHTPAIILWNGVIQTLTDDYTVAGKNITFTASAGIPQTNDKIVNIYG